MSTSRARLRQQAIPHPAYAAADDENFSDEFSEEKIRRTKGWKRSGPLSAALPGASTLSLINATDLEPFSSRVNKYT